MIYDKEKARQDMEQDRAASQRAIFDLIEHNALLDEDDYPTDAALDIVRLWHWTDAEGWFKFIRGLWHLRDWGWKESDERDCGKMIHVYHISTAGWSGNESIVNAMQENHMLWRLNWLQSRRGGHYIFELREFNED